MTHINVNLPFRDRPEAGRLLATRLEHYAGRSDVIVFALPRGGVPVAAEIARALDAPLNVYMVRKIGVPGHEELAMGAIAGGGETLMNHSIIQRLHISEQEVAEAVQSASRELRRRELLYSRGRKLPDVRNKIVILVDDSMATGLSMLLAAQALRTQGAAYIVVAAPVAPPAAISQLNQVADAVACLAEPGPFVAVSHYYEDFEQLTDEEICVILDAMFERRRELQFA